ncbi:hypothetical protein NL676_034208 [Syzygium grande]|nr:hypothetical protein NL676_034208 [Syzygium grande]
MVAGHGSAWLSVTGEALGHGRVLGQATSEWPTAGHLAETVWPRPKIVAMRAWPVSWGWQPDGNGNGGGDDGGSDGLG